ncbi:hypothetical protein Kfla_1429 [Kribbella flavida DSM 17836]|uniref:Uncharacterized protein n=1 Tax=Kribbella flavida (strain DSM 17836 / JCM 10339 / NBRC 14399) TaxID=479435 RepID=D2PKL8_KRIFD|nr:hypothetical protein [Kribbella flavida]ADB30530.1 hypothetical protein Kfla_1429 [Kribbella flavida DSM 17836]
MTPRSAAALAEARRAARPVEAREGRGVARRAAVAGQGVLR